MNWFNLSIYTIFLVKIIFLMLVSYLIYLKIKGKANTEQAKKTIYWKDRLEFIFKCLMSCLLIYLFNPRINRLNKIDNETKLLLYLFGFVLIITADWSVFIKETKLVKYITKQSQ